MPELIHGKMTKTEPTRVGRVVVSSKTKPKSIFASTNGQIRLLLLKLLIKLFKRQICGVIETRASFWTRVRKNEFCFKMAAMGTVLNKEYPWQPPRGKVDFGQSKSGGLRSRKFSRN